MRKNKTTRFMSGILMLFFGMLFIVLLGRFFYIQASGEVDGISLKKYAEKMRTTSYTLKPKRGTIYDSNGTTLAYNQPTFDLYAIIDPTYTKNPKEPMHVKDPKKTADVLAPLLDVDKRYILERLEKGIKNNKFQVEFGTAGKDIEKKTKDKIVDLDLPGIRFNKKQARHYPNGIFASRIIGLTKKKNHQPTGITGLEGKYNKLLSGENGYISYEHDNYGIKLLHPEQTVKKPVDGDDIYLTLNEKIQTLLENKMSDVAEKYKPKRITAVVMDPKTGEILAMSNRPSYNPGDPGDVKNWYNDVISTPFEVGSTMKIFTWAAAIDAGVYHGNEKYHSGEYKIGKNVQPIHDWNRSWGSITYDQGLIRSSNVGAAKLAWEKLGPEKYLQYLKGFDFDKKTGIDLPGEVSGKLLFNWPIEKVTTSFGQGTTLTPIQEMKAATAIANDGKMMKPYIVSKITNPNNDTVVRKKTPKAVGQPITKETANKVRDLMEEVVSSEHGTGSVYKLDDYTLAGKTGTAQIPNPKGGYLTGANDYVFSFLGMAPADNPELMMYVAVQQPDLEVDGDRRVLGSQPVSEIFKDVMKNGLHYMDVLPDKVAEQTIHTITVPNLIGKSAQPVKKALLDKGFSRISIIGNGKKIVKANVTKGEQLFSTDSILLMTNKPALPDLTGWSLRDVLELADMMNLNMEVHGTGFVTTQSIPKGSVPKKNAKLRISLKKPS